MNKVTRTMNSNKNNEHRTTNNTELHNRENGALHYCKRPFLWSVSVSNNYCKSTLVFVMPTHFLHITVIAEFSVSESGYSEDYFV
jgi:hypothetical protein